MMKKYNKFLIGLLISILSLTTLFSNISLAQTVTQEKDVTYHRLDIGVIHAWKHSGQNGEWQGDIVWRNSRSIL